MGYWGSTAHQTAVPSLELDDMHSHLLQTEPPKHTEMKDFLLSTNTASDLSPRLVDAPLTECAVTAHTVHSRLIRAELHIVHLSLVGKPSTKTLLLEYIYTCTQRLWHESKSECSHSYVDIDQILPKSRIIPSIAPVSKRLLLWLKDIQFTPTGRGDSGREHCRRKITANTHRVYK